MRGLLFSPRRQVWAAIAGLAVLAATVGCNTQDAGVDSESDFRSFFETYVQEVRERDADYLGSVHPELPTEMHEFFFDLTQDMMKHADEQGLEPSIDCEEYDVCKVTWPQPGDSWAAQSFIRHEGSWRFLPG